MSKRAARHAIERRYARIRLSQVVRCEGTDGTFRTVYDTYQLAQSAGDEMRRAGAKVGAVTKCAVAPHFHIRHAKRPNP